MAGDELKALRDRKREAEQTAGHLADAPKVDKATALRCELRDRLLAKVAEYKVAQATGTANPKLDSQIRNLSQALLTATDKADKADKPRQRREPRPDTWQRKTVCKARHYRVKAAHWQPITWHGKL